ncbi:MAG: hypothetical protein QNJ63_26955 [Calothrix sp. MO_192.B10]|nr:hypothetical protein [Calothrix sp. MO_192.B10]
MYTQVYKYLLSQWIDVWDDKYYIWIYQPKQKAIAHSLRNLRDRLLTLIKGDYHYDIPEACYKHNFVQMSRLVFCDRGF